MCNNCEESAMHLFLHCDLPFNAINLDVANVWDRFQQVLSVVDTSQFVSFCMFMLGNLVPA